MTTYRYGRLLHRLHGALPLVAFAVLLGACMTQDDAGEGTAVDSTLAAGTFAGPIGVQLYSFRNQLAEDVPGTLAQVAAMGFDEVEVFSLHGRPAAGFKQLLAENGLRATSFMVDYGRLRDSLDAVIADAKTLGAEYVVTAWIPHEEPFTREAAERAAADFNAWGERLRAEGLQFAYHVHGYEFQPSEEGTLFDALVAATNPEHVAFQMDVFWVFYPGQDPVALLEHYPNRWVSMHLKDLQQGVPRGDLSGHAPVETNVVLGTGQIDFPAVLKAAQEAGVKRYYIEDESPAVMEQVPQSLDYLRGGEKGRTRGE